MTLKPLLRAARPANAAMSFLAVLVGGLVVPSFTVGGTPDLVLAGAIAALVLAGGNVVNDLFDLDIDRVNRPDRPLPSGNLSIRSAKLASAALLGSSLLGALVNPVVLAVAAFNATLLYAYSWKLKGIPLAGNAAVAYLVGSAFLFGGAAVGGLLEAVPLFLLAFLATLGREIAKDVEDLPGDRGHVHTLATRHGPGTPSTAAAAALVLAVAVSPLPYLLDVMGTYFLPLAAAADIVLLAAAARLLRERSVEGAARAQRTVKLGMALALLAFFAGAV